MKQLYREILNSETKTYSGRNGNVLIIDGMNTFIRTWSTNRAMNEDGEHVGGVVGALNSIASQIRDFNATRTIVVFDGKGGSDTRKRIYEGYKAGREKNRFRVNRQYAEMMTEEEEREAMKQQFIWLNDILDHLPITTMIYDGIEADDVIAYMAKELCDEEVVIVSTDKDFLQLVSDDIRIYSPTKKITYNRQQVYDEFGIWPENILLYRILDGDTGDNIPGIKGCGLKTLLKRFPEIGEDRKISVDEFIQLAETKRGRIKLYDTIVENQDQLHMNKRLMELDVHHIPNHQKLLITGRFNEPDKPLSKLEFMKVATKYKILDSWMNLMQWLNASFGNIIVK